MANQGQFELIYPVEDPALAAEYDRVVQTGTSLFESRTKVGRPSAATASKPPVPPASMREKLKSAVASGRKPSSSKEPMGGDTKDVPRGEEGVAKVSAPSA